MAELTFDTSLGVPVTSGDGIYYYTEIPGTPEIEVYRVRSSVDGDFILSRRLNKIKSIMIQNHGATFATGGLTAGADPPKTVITQGTNTSSAKITINHSATAEFFSIIVFGEL